MATDIAPIAAAMRGLDEFMAAFNARGLAAFEATFNFPSVRLEQTPTRWDHLVGDDLLQNHKLRAFLIRSD
jgi:hypothetical protein